MRTYRIVAVTALLGLLSAPAFAAGKTVTVSQHNMVNASVVAVVGNGSKVSVTQVGFVNGSVVGQIGFGSKSIVTQLGTINVSSTTQGN
jgi:hypothetical protein